MRCAELICAECGKVFEKPRNEYNRKIRNGAEKFFCSISCSAIYSNRILPRKGDIANFGEHIHIRQKDELSPFRWFMRRVLNRKTRARKGETNITIEFLADLWNQQKGICPISGILLSLPSGTEGHIKDNKLKPYSASLDRIDNNLGYLQGNVRFVAVMANYARNKFGDKEVIDFCNAVSEFNKSK